jgi:hypothetical protein
MAAYVACPHCFCSVPSDRLRTRRKWRCARCKRDVEASSDLRWEVWPKGRLLDGLLWTGAVLVAAALTGMIVWLRVR